MRRVINLRFKRDSRVEIFEENFLRGGEPFIYGESTKPQCKNLFCFKLPK